MRKFLSVFLAVMMVVSTVSFAAPSTVTVADSATNAVVETTEETTEVAELAADSEYGTLVFNIDFEKDGISFAKNTAVAVSTITDDYNADICPSGITFTTRNFVDEPQLVTDETGNTYLSCVNTTGEGGYRFFQITEGDNSLDWTDGTFTMVIDYYYTGGLNSIAFHGRLQLLSILKNFRISTLHLVMLQATLTTLVLTISSFTIPQNL